MFAFLIAANLMLLMKFFLIFLLKDFLENYG